MKTTRIPNFAMHRKDQHLEVVGPFRVDSFIMRQKPSLTRLSTAQIRDAPSPKEATPMKTMLTFTHLALVGMVFSLAPPLALGLRRGWLECPSLRGTKIASCPRGE